MKLKTGSLIESVLEHKIGQRLLMVLLDDWLSAREASIACRGIDAEKQRSYTMDKHVSYYFNLLKKQGFLEERVVEKKKQRMSKKGNLGSYTSIWPRYRLDLPKFIVSYFAGKKPLSPAESEMLSGVLKNPAIDKLIRTGNRLWGDVLTKLVFMLITIKMRHLKLKGADIPPFFLHETAPELLSHFTKEEVDNFTLAVENIVGGKYHTAFTLAEKMINASIPITFTSKDYDRFVPQIAQMVADCAVRARDNVLKLFQRGGYRLHKRRVNEAISAGFAKYGEKLEES